MLHRWLQRSCGRANPLAGLQPKWRSGDQGSSVSGGGGRRGNGELELESLVVGRIWWQWLIDETMVAAAVKIELGSGEVNDVVGVTNQ